jgi:hypothetical protein
MLVSIDAYFAIAIFALVSPWVADAGTELYIRGESAMKRTSWILCASAVTVTLGLLAAGGSASAQLSSTRPAPRTKAQWQADIAHVREPRTGCYRASYPALAWHATRCVTARRIPLAPGPRPLPSSARPAGPALVGDNTDYSAQVAGSISQATGTFQDVSPGITEQGYVDGEGSLTANAFTLQLNSQYFYGSPACNGSSDPAGCEAWRAPRAGLRMKATAISTAAPPG